MWSFLETIGYFREKSHKAHTPSTYGDIINNKKLEGSAIFPCASGYRVKASSFI